MTEKNFEIEHALQIIDLLKQYKSMKSIFKIRKRKQIKQQIKNISEDIYISMNKFSSDELITRITKAISLNKHRPKNMPVIALALSDDLYDIHGDFSTFDLELNKMDKNQESPKKLCEHFRQGMKNLDILAKQFAYDWIQILDKHKDLVKAARTATAEYEITAYNMLLYKIAEDFSKKHGDFYVDVKIVKDFTSMVQELKSLRIHTDDIEDDTEAVHVGKYIFLKPLSETNIRTREKISYEQNPDIFPIFMRDSIIRMRMDIIKKRYKPEHVFYAVVSNFAHEMNHALNFHRPNDGALGKQIFQISQRKTNIKANIYALGYYSNPDERSSFAIQNKLFNQLKTMQY